MSRLMLDGLVMFLAAFLGLLGAAVLVFFWAKKRLLMVQAANSSTTPTGHRRPWRRQSDSAWPTRTWACGRRRSRWPLGTSTTTWGGCPLPGSTLSSSPGPAILVSPLTSCVVRPSVGPPTPRPPISRDPPSSTVGATAAPSAIRASADPPRATDLGTLTDAR